MEVSKFQRKSTVTLGQTFYRVGWLSIANATAYDVASLEFHVVSKDNESGVIAVEMTANELTQLVQMLSLLEQAMKMKVCIRGHHEELQP